MTRAECVTVHVGLLDEGTDCWRPTLALDLGEGTYRLLGTEDYDPDDEKWEFLPGALVCCEPREFADGSTRLVAVRSTDRPISEAETAVVEWLLEHGYKSESLTRLLPSVRQLRVVGGCPCGCATIDFVEFGRLGPARILADAVGYDSAGRECGLILWERDGRISTLEIYEHDGDSSKEIPAVATLIPWEKHRA